MTDVAVTYPYMVAEYQVAHTHTQPFPVVAHEGKVTRVLPTVADRLSLPNIRRARESW